MRRRDLSAHLDRINNLATEINQHVPVSAHGAVDFRADLAGLLVVAIAASYESCVKETLVGYASLHGKAFEQFTKNNFDKLSSRIQLSDLHRYAKLFDQGINKKFSETISFRKERINRRLGKNIEKCYEQILDWRHDFAHAGIRNTTIEEAIATHRLARHVVISFYDAFGVRS